MTVADARDAWNAVTFAGEFAPSEPDANPNAVVDSQAMSQDGAPFAAEPGVTCLDPALDPPIDVDVEPLGEPWADPPPAPCQVPHLIDKSRPDGEDEWFAAGFAGTYSPSNGDWQIKSQSLVGFSWLPCESSITVSEQP
jgi:hypothetical protein